MNNKLKKLAKEICESLLIDEISDLVDQLMIERDIKRHRFCKSVTRDREIRLDKDTSIHPVCKH